MTVLDKVTAWWAGLGTPAQVLIGAGVPVVGVAAYASSRRAAARQASSSDGADGTAGPGSVLPTMDPPGLAGNPALSGAVGIDSIADLRTSIADQGQSLAERIALSEESAAFGNASLADRLASISEDVSEQVSGIRDELADLRAGQNDGTAPPATDGSPSVTLVRFGSEHVFHLMTDQIRWLQSPQAAQTLAGSGWRQLVRDLPRPALYRLAKGDARVFVDVAGRRRHVADAATAGAIAGSDWRSKVTVRS